MQLLRLLILGVAIIGLGGCQTSFLRGTPGPLVQPSGSRMTTSGPTATPGACLAWCCGPERGRLVRRPWTLALEAGPVWSARNDVAIPGDTGTRLALDDVTGSGPFAWTRATVTARLGTRHEARLLFAPLTIEETGLLPHDVRFRGRTFVAGVPTTATYRFDSWRATWRYLLLCGDDWTLKVGGTLKVRSAEIALEQAGQSERKVDLGLVPLAHASFEKRLAPRWRFEADLDGLAAPQGRAFDASVRLLYDASDRWSVGVGYRTLEGGADNDDVYTFAWLHQAFLAFEVRF